MEVNMEQSDSKCGGCLYYLSPPWWVTMGYHPPAPVPTATYWMPPYGGQQPPPPQASVMQPPVMQPPVTQPPVTQPPVTQPPTDGGDDPFGDIFGTVVDIAKSLLPMILS